jgi:hypothetical protein
MPPKAVPRQDNIAGRRKARLTFAKRRLAKILDAEPRFTPDEIAELVAILQGKK